MNLESVLEMWKKDSQIEQYNLDETSREYTTVACKILRTAFYC